MEQSTQWIIQKKWGKDFTFGSDCTVPSSRLRRLRSPAVYRSVLLIGQSPSCQVCPKFPRDLSTSNSWSFASKTRFFLIANMGSYQSARRSGNCCRLQMTGLRLLIMENGSMHASWMWLKLSIALTTIFSKSNCPVLV